MVLYLVTKQPLLIKICLFYILFEGSDVNRQDMDGKTPLMLACVHDDDGKSVEYLLNHKADPCIVDNKVSK